MSSVISIRKSAISLAMFAATNGKILEMESVEIARQMPHDRDRNVEKSVRPAKSTFTRPRQRIG